MHKYIINLTADGALNTLAVWQGQPDLRPMLAQNHVYDEPQPARDALAEMIRRANEEGACEPGHEYGPCGCGRCVNWPPRIWQIDLEIVPVI